MSDVRQSKHGEHQLLGDTDPQQVPSTETSAWPASTTNAPARRGASDRVQQGQDTNITINNSISAPPIQFVAGKSGHGLITRVLWFVFIGWWLSALFITIGYLLAATILLLPLGLWFLHRVPKAQTLRERGRAYTQKFNNGIWEVTEGTTAQFPFLARVAYTLFIGLWAGAVWLALAWLVSLPVITLPLSVWMIDRSPAIISLQKN